MDGKEAVRRIRAMDGGLEVKIVAVTASAYASDREEVLAAKVDDFVLKPYQPSEIFDCLARHLGLRRVLGTFQEEHQGVQLTNEVFAALPRELVQRLRGAIVSLDQKRIREAIEEISQRDAAVGQKLASMAACFAYTAILDALPPENDQSPG